MKTKLLLLMFLLGCKQKYHECTTLNPGKDYRKIIISNGNFQGKYYCTGVYAEHAANCIEIYSKWSETSEPCYANDVLFTEVLYGSGTVEIE